jgi:hypothetical protein
MPTQWAFLFVLQHYIMYNNQMNLNNTLIVDNLLTDEQCDAIINRFSSLLIAKETPPRNYYFYDIIFEQSDYAWIGEKCLSLYEDAYPELKLTVDNRCVTPLRMKKFINNEFYNDWHSEHCVDYPNRTASILIYLSDHDCGTEFITGDVINSVKGRAVIFPASWTHTHRGQPCPAGNDRYIMSAYVELEKKYV